jgi:acyl carrier protein
MNLVREHLAEELEVDPESIAAGTRFKEDLDADSLDLYELVMELEDRYGISVSEQDAARIETVGDAVSFVLERAPA